MTVLDQSDYRISINVMTVVIKMIIYVCTPIICNICFFTENAEDRNYRGTEDWFPVL